MPRKPKALILMSGGLDSVLTARLVLDQGIRAEAIHFTDPFSGGSAAARMAKQLGIRLHQVSRARELLRLVKKPKHGYGSQVNPCIDCRIASFRKAWRLAKQKGFSFLVTGEVLGQRPMSQRRPELMRIEKEAGLRGKVLRPLSAKLLPETEAERRGWVDRERLLAISGRSRREQMALAKKLGIRDYPTPAGGCLLTDPGYARKMKDFLKHNKALTELDAELLKVGRHFRLGKAKIIVGRNEQENGILQKLARKNKIPWLEVKDYMGPVTLLFGSGALEKAARITARYSDAPDRKVVDVTYQKGKVKKILKARALGKRTVERMRI